MPNLSSALNIGYFVSHNYSDKKIGPYDRPEKQETRVY